MNTEWNKWQTYYNDNHTLVETSQYYNVGTDKIRRRIKLRTISESAKIAHTLKKSAFAWSQERKEKMSVTMKKAIKEGRAKGWANLPRHKRKRSYAELFFEKVICNEFADTMYEYEYPISIYSLDFAWPHKKRCIEIDGQQHSQIERMESDIKKDKYLKSCGWSVLRIKWVDIFREPQTYIKIAYNFIHQ
jgi:very-short-patch-repair endonuclease